jgi:hypothetical protein
VRVDDHGARLTLVHRVLVLGGGAAGYFAASEEEKREVFLPAFRAVLARWEELGARVVASFCDDVLQVGPGGAPRWAWYLLFDVDDLGVCASMMETARSVDRWVQFEVRLGRPFYAREETGSIETP